MKAKVLKNLVFYRLLWLNWLGVFVLGGLSLWGGKHYLPFLFILVSNLFDCYGYYIVLVDGWTLNYGERRVVAYRIIQNLFDYTWLGGLFILGNWALVLAGLILKWTAVQDLLFYLFLNEPLPREWWWLKWTPWGKLKGKPLSNLEVFIQALLGLIISTILAIKF